MEFKDKVKKTREYLDYLEEHYDNVQKAWKELQEKCKDMRFVYDDYMRGYINNEVNNHDMSKLSKNEFTQYRENFYPVDDKEKKNSDFSSAWEPWEHHKENNLHHWENWTTKQFPDPYSWEVHCVHMVCDWMAMSYKFGDTAQEYYSKNKDKIILPDYAIAFIQEIFRRLK